MKLLHWTPLTIAGAITVVVSAIVVALLHLPLNRALAEAQVPVNTVDAITIKSGSVYVTLGQATMWRLSYRWCPRSGLTAWCVDGHNNGSFVRGVVRWQGGTALTLSEATISAHSDHLSSNTRMASFSLSGSARAIAVESLACGQQNITFNDAQVTVSNIRVLGKYLSDAQVFIDGGQPPRLSVSGSFSGSGQIENGSLSLQTRLSAEADIPNINTGWSLKATFPCLT